MLFQWAELASGRYPELKLLYAVPNGSHKSIPTAMKFKREGLKAGVPDIVLPVARGGYHSLYIEMKRTKGGVLSREQLDWQIALLDAGHRVVIARGFEEARRTITDYLEAA